MRKLEITKTLSEEESENLDRWLNNRNEIIKLEIENNPIIIQHDEIVKNAIANMLTDAQEMELIELTANGNKEAEMQLIKSFDLYIIYSILQVGNNSLSFIEYFEIGRKAIIQLVQSELNSTNIERSYRFVHWSIMQSIITAK